jgi:hypothetical protein
MFSLRLFASMVITLQTFDHIADTVSFMVLGAGFAFLDVFEPCSGVQPNYLETI